MNKLILLILFVLSLISCTDKDDKDISSEEKLEVCFLNSDIGEWSEMAFSQDGIISYIKNGKDNKPVTALLFLPNDSVGGINCLVGFDSNSVPEIININDLTIVVNSYNDEGVDVTIVSGDTLVFSLDNLNCKLSLSNSLTRNWQENNWQRNLSAIIDVVSGVATIGLGSISIFGAVVAEVPTFGLSTLAITGGVITVSSGINSVYNGWQKLYASGELYENSDVVQTVAYEAASIVPDCIKNHKWKMKEWLNESTLDMKLNKLNSIAFLAVFGTSLLDQVWGHTVTDAKKNALLHAEYHIETGLVKDITQTSATILGYISPDATMSFNEGQIEYEYGIVVYSADNLDRFSHVVKNGKGGLIEYDLSSLDEGKTYNYFTYFYDKTNYMFKMGNVRHFTTIKMPVKITNVKLNDVLYHSDFYTINDVDFYSFRYECSVDVSIIDGENVIDWGYYYQDVYGKRVYISISEFGTSFKDDRFVFYRNHPNMSIMLGEYVKYKDTDKLVTLEPRTYEFSYPEDISLKFVHADFGNTTSGSFYGWNNSGPFKYRTTSTVKLEIKGAFYIQKLYSKLSAGWYPGPTGISVYDGLNSWEKSFVYDTTNGCILSYYCNSGYQTSNQINYLATSGGILTSCHIEGLTDSTLKKAGVSRGFDSLVPNDSSTSKKYVEMKKVLIED